MLQAFDNMLMPTLYSQVANAQVEELRDDGLDFFINIGDEYKIPHLEKIFDKQLKMEQILIHATDVANKLGLNSVETFKKFNQDCKKYGRDLYLDIDFNKLDYDLQDVPGFFYDKNQYLNSIIAIRKDQADLCDVNGYKSNRDLEATLLGILAYLVKTIDEPEIKSVDEVLGGKKPADTSTSASNTSTGGASAGTSAASVANTTSSESGGSLIVSALVLGGLGLTAAYFYTKSKSKV